jgi:hypothetical protein
MCDGNHFKGDGSWWDSDARGIPTARVCDDCIKMKRSRYRPEIFETSSYDCDERVEADY